MCVMWKSVTKTKLLLCGKLIGAFKRLRMKDFYVRLLKILAWCSSDSGLKNYSQNS